jgi:hypothetical protein
MQKSIYKVEKYKHKYLNTIDENKKLTYKKKIEYYESQSGGSLLTLALAQQYLPNNPLLAQYKGVTPYSLLMQLERIDEYIANKFLFYYENIKKPSVGKSFLNNLRIIQQNKDFFNAIKGAFHKYVIKLEKTVNDDDLNGLYLPHIDARESNDIKKIPEQTVSFFERHFYNKKFPPTLTCYEGSIHSSSSQLVSLSQLKYLDTHSSLAIDEYNGEMIKLMYLTINWPPSNFINHLDRYSLKVLNIGWGNNITDDILSSFVNLHTLSLRYCNNVTNDGINRLPNLGSLAILYCPKITDDGIKRMKNLIHFSSQKEISDEGIQGLYLEFLQMSPLGKITINTVKDIITLKTLHFVSRQMANDLFYLANLENLKNLKTLSIDTGRYISCDNMKILPNLEIIRNIQMRDPRELIKLKVEGLLPKLQRVYIPFFLDNPYPYFERKEAIMLDTEFRKYGIILENLHGYELIADLK